MDPEFLAALPEELQREVVESRRRVLGSVKKHSG